MDLKSPDFRDLLRDIHNFLTNTLSNEILSGNAKAHREELVQKLSLFPDIMPPYIDMNGCAKSKSQFEEYVDISTNENHSGSKLYEEFPDQGGSQSVNLDVLQQTLVKYENLTIPVSKLKDVAKKFGPLWRKAKILFVEHSTCSWGGIFGDVLYIYNSDKEAKPASLIHIRGFEARPAPAYCLNNGKKRDCCFELVCPGKKSYQFIARTAKDMEQWIACINEVSFNDTEMIQRKRELPSLPPSADGREEYDDIQARQTEETDEEIYHDIGELNIALQIPQIPLQQSQVVSETDSEILYDDICANNPSSMYYNMAEQKPSGVSESDQKTSEKDNKIKYDDEEDIYDDVNLIMRIPKVPKPRYLTSEASKSIQQVVQKIETRNKKHNVPCVSPESVECAKLDTVDTVDDTDIPFDNFYEPIDNLTDDSNKQI